MGRAGDWCDNAVAESFWVKLKTEIVYHKRFRTKGEARAAVFDYMEVFYNCQRLHAALGYQKAPNSSRRAGAGDQSVSMETGSWVT